MITYLLLLLVSCSTLSAMDMYVPEVEDDLWRGKYLLLHEKSSENISQNECESPSKKMKKIVSTRIVTSVDPLQFKLEDLVQDITKHIEHKTDVLFLLSWRKIIPKAQDPIHAIANDDQALYIIQDSIGKGFCIRYVGKQEESEFNGESINTINGSVQDKLVRLLDKKTYGSMGYPEHVLMLKIGLMHGCQ